MATMTIHFNSDMSLHVSHQRREDQRSWNPQQQWLSQESDFGYYAYFPIIGDYEKQKAENQYPKIK